uniref:Uncharacterized protein n=1 Tax=Globodera rostochiensis TaxID=31243 RepID=A0A914H3R3_GLORO
MVELFNDFEANDEMFKFGSGFQWSNRRAFKNNTTKSVYVSGSDPPASAQPPIQREQPANPPRAESVSSGGIDTFYEDALLSSTETETRTVSKTDLKR